MVSYGGHGGGKCNKQLREILQSVRMSPIERNIELAFPRRSLLVRAARGQNIGVVSGSKPVFWEEKRKAIANAYGEPLQMLAQGV